MYILANSVILESPLRPVEDGENVTLHCSYKIKYDDEPTSDFSADFYKDDVFIGRSYPGKIILKVEEGFYKCRHPSKGESPQSWLTVRGEVLLQYLIQAMVTRNGTFSLKVKTYS